MTAKSKRLVVYLLSVGVILLGVLIDLHGITLLIESFGISSSTLASYSPILSLIIAFPISSVLAIQGGTITSMGTALIFVGKGMTGLAMWSFVAGLLIFMLFTALTIMVGSIFAFVWIALLVVLVLSHDAF